MIRGREDDESGDSETSSPPPLRSIVSPHMEQKASQNRHIPLSSGGGVFRGRGARGSLHTRISDTNDEREIRRHKISKIQSFWEIREWIRTVTSRDYRNLLRSRDTQTAKEWSYAREYNRLECERTVDIGRRMNQCSMFEETERRRVWQAPGWVLAEKIEVENQQIDLRKYERRKKYMCACVWEGWREGEREREEKRREQSGLTSGHSVNSLYVQTGGRTLGRIWKCDS